MGSCPDTDTDPNWAELLQRKQDVIFWTWTFNTESDCSDEGLTLETSAFLPSTVANLRFQPSC